MDAFTKGVLDYIVDSPSKVSFSDLVGYFKDDNQFSRKKLKRVVSNLIRSGHLCYTSHFGRSYIERSYDQAIPVSEHVVVKPASTTWHNNGEQYIVQLERGASFGGGEHPTTRMAIQLIDALLHQPPWLNKRKTMRAMDVGTGSGILALVAASIGIGCIHGIDTDRCAVFEAQRNIRLNDFEDHIFILEEPLEKVDFSYSLILANLRTPTLLGLRKTFQKIADSQNALIFSGFKTEEASNLYHQYQKMGYRLQKKLSEKGWGAMCLTRG